MKKLFAFLISSLMISAPAWAWSPTKPIEVYIGFAAGSGNELVFRVLAAEVEKNTGAKFVIQLKPGAGGAIASRQLISQTPDGHTVAMVIGEGIPVQDKISVPDSGTRGYTVDDFTYLIAPAANQYAVIANGSDSINSNQDLAKALRTDPLSFAASGGARLPYEVLKQKTTFKDVAHVQHTGPVPAVTDIAGGHVRLGIVPSLVANRYVSDGKIKIIALTGNKRLPQLPGVPTLGETFTGTDVITTWGLVGPRGMPSDVTNWYVREFTKALQSESVKEFWNKNLLEIPDAKLLTSKGFEDYVRKTEKQYENIVTVVNQTSGKK